MDPSWDFEQIQGYELTLWRFCFSISYLANGSNQN